MKAVDVAMMTVNAALYTIVGYLTNLGIVSPVVGVVRFWPSVIVPAIFASLFGPWVGGIGAAIGIFFADMIHPGHGIVTLSLTVGVPSNFLGFWLVGYISRKNVGRKHIASGLVFTGILAAITAYLLAQALLPLEVSLLFFGVLTGCWAISIAAFCLLPEWKSYELASVVGLAVGSAWIGFSLWGYSQVLPLPLTFSPWDRAAPFIAGFFWLTWTFVSEIPFLAVLGPPILKACYRAFPSLKPKERADKK